MVDSEQQRAAPPLPPRWEYFILDTSPRPNPDKKRQMFIKFNTESGSGEGGVGRWVGFADSSVAGGGGGARRTLGTAAGARGSRGGGAGMGGPAAGR